MRRVAISAAALSVFQSKPLRCSACFESGFSLESAKQAMKARGIFSDAAIEQYAKEFEELGFDYSYHKFGSAVVNKHYEGYICAKAERAQGGQLYFANEEVNSAFYICQSSKFLELAESIDLYLSNRRERTKEEAVSVRTFMAQTDDLILSHVEYSPFTHPEAGAAVRDGEKPPVLETIASSRFLAMRSEEAQKRYQNILHRMDSGYVTTYDLIVADNGDIVFTIAFNPDRPSYLGVILSLIMEVKDATIIKYFLESFSHGVQVYTLHVRGATKERVEAQATLLPHLPSRPHSAITRMLQKHDLNASEMIYSHCLIIFAFYFTPQKGGEDYFSLVKRLEHDRMLLTRLTNLQNQMHQEVMSERALGNLISANKEIIRRLYEDFAAGSTEARREEIQKDIKKLEATDPQTARMLLTFLRFNEAIMKHNFFKVNKAAIAFYVDPAIVLKGQDYLKIPFSIVLLIGPRWRGFHLRFSEIARGGVRMIDDLPSKYKRNKISLFKENYGLSSAQMLKNKDIPEGGSKGTILIDTRSGTVNKKMRSRIFRQYVDALLDVLLANQQDIYNPTNRSEIVFLGPDENTAGELPTIGMFDSKRRGYVHWRTFTSGKDPKHGGIPHDTYGMTTLGVRQCVKGLYEKLGIEETSVRKFQTGGPDGDLGGNEIKQGREKTIAIVDRSGVAYDPQGLERNELLRLVDAHCGIVHFARQRLSPGGFVVAADDSPVTLPCGTSFSSGLAFCDTFHLTRFAVADLFVPCGGRPAAISLENVHHLVRSGQKLRGEDMINMTPRDIGMLETSFQYVVEGANLFITPDARMALERVGVQLIKDSTANKGGVTCSSFEVLTGLALSDDEFDKNMRVIDNHTPPLYASLVREIQSIIQKNAQKEFERIWKEQQKYPSLTKSALSDRLSQKIYEMRTSIAESSLLEDESLVHHVVRQYAPRTLQQLVPAPTIVERVPRAYIRSLVAVWLASNFVYEFGLQSTEVDFYCFLSQTRK